MEKTCDSITLTLVNCVFPNNIIPNNWLSSTIQIKKLTIDDNSSINDIEIDSFNSMPFRNTEHIQITNPNILHLKYGIFRGLSKLTTLVLFKWPIIDIDSNILHHTPLLQTLQIEESHGSLLNVQNVTGTTSMLGLQTVSLRYNNLCRTIDHRTFKGLSGILSLYLSKSHIRSITANTFDCIAETIQQIYLDGNFLKMLPVKLFDKFPTTNNWKMYLSDNQWQCDCNLYDLKQLIESKAKHFPYSVICYGPIEVSGKNILNVLLQKCPTMTVDKKNLSDVSCQSCSNSKGNSVIEIHNQSNSYQDIDVKVEIPTDDYELLWFDRNFTCQTIDLRDNDENLCPDKYQKVAKISNLSIGSTYTFCVIKKMSSMLSPFDCTAYYVKSNDLLDGKFPYEDKSFVLVLIFVILLICAILFGIVFGACLAKRYPTFIKSTTSKVVIQQLSRNEVWRKTEEKNKKKLYRSVSEGSVASSRSYVTAVVPFPIDRVNWKMNKNVISAEVHRNADDVMDDLTPPPIPNRNPLKQHLNFSSMECELSMMKKSYCNRMESSFA